MDTPTIHDTSGVTFVSFFACVKFLVQVATTIIRHIGYPLLINVIVGDAPHFFAQPGQAGRTLAVALAP